MRRRAQLVAVGRTAGVRWQQTCDQTQVPISHRWSQWRKEWKEFAAQPPGRRFRDRREHRRAAHGPKRWWRRALNIGIGVLLLIVGLFFAIAPGPAVVFFALGGLFIANESKVAAHLLDRIDVLLAPALAWVVKRWKGLSRPARRVATICLVSGSVVAFAVGFMVLR